MNVERTDASISFPWGDALRKFTVKGTDQKRPQAELLKQGRNHVDHLISCRLLCLEFVGRGDEHHRAHRSMRPHIKKPAAPVAPTVARVLLAALGRMLAGSGWQQRQGPLRRKASEGRLREVREDGGALAWTQTFSKLGWFWVRACASTLRSGCAALRTLNSLRGAQAHRDRRPHAQRLPQASACRSCHDHDEAQPGQVDEMQLDHELKLVP